MTNSMNLFYQLIIKNIPYYNSSSSEYKMKPGSFNNLDSPILTSTFKFFSLFDTSVFDPE